MVHIGDSTSEGLISPDYLPDPTQRIDAQYRDVGVSNVDLEIDGGTSILETVKAGQANAYQVTQNKIAGGYQGCWVLALGTNDTADVYVGSVENQTQRIDKMMSAIGNQPVLWLTVKSLLASGPYAETQMAKWNQALLSACARYPNMRVYDWASVSARLLVHQRRHPLHHDRLRQPCAPHRRSAGRRLPRGQSGQHQLRRLVTPRPHRLLARPGARVNYPGLDQCWKPPRGICHRLFRPIRRLENQPPIVDRTLCDVSRQRW